MKMALRLAAVACIALTSTGCFCNGPLMRWANQHNAWLCGSNNCNQCGTVGSCGSCCDYGTSGCGTTCCDPCAGGAVVGSSGCSNCAGGAAVSPSGTYIGN